MSKHVVVSSHIHAPGHAVEVGEVIELEDKDARWRTGLGLVKPWIDPESPASAATKPGAPETEEQEPAAAAATPQEGAEAAAAESPTTESAGAKSGRRK